MNIAKTWIHLLLSATVVCTVMFGIVIAYDDPTHQVISERAVNQSVLDSYLRGQLGFTSGIQEVFKGRRVEQWIPSGALSEDAPVTRVIYHFHNPLQPWNQAGLTIGSELGKSSLLWNQQPNQSNFLGAGSGSWSWFNARQQYYDALSKGSKAEREQSFADLFRSLGQGTHLLQDATLPAHVRNDQHLNWTFRNLPLFGNVTVGDPDGYEKWAEKNITPGDPGSVNSTPIKPSISIFTPTNDSQAPVPLARLFDTDRYNGQNPSILSDPDVGITEFTNSNFLSKDTIFKDFSYPRSADLLPNPIIEATGAKYYSRILPTGDTVTHFVRESLLGKILRFATGTHPPSAGWILDDKIHENYSRLLLPRAVGYSVSYIDHFFRGKLEFDVVDGDNPADSRQVRLEGKNFSSEKLDGGTLELYGEDAQGVRTAATPIGSTTVTADPTQPISATFRLPPNTDKLMAVYKGKLGNEAPSTDFIGAVIGKSLSLEKVEQIFTDFTRWYLRSPEGVFPLPLLKSDVDDLQWGDDDNMMVGRSSVGPGEPNLFYTYRIDRPSGATNIPLTGSGEVLIQTINQYPFPMGMSSDTMIDFSHKLPYKQYLFWQNTETVANWIATPTEDNPNAGYYDQTQTITYGTDLLVDETQTASYVTPIILDESSHSFGDGTDRYFWDVWSIHLTSGGTPLALIRVDLSSGNLGFATFPSRTLGENGSNVAAHPKLVELPPVQVPFHLPEIGGIWMLVDVSTGQVVANTAPSTLMVHHETGRISYTPNPNQSITSTTWRSMGSAIINGGDNAGSTTSGGDVLFAQPTGLCSVPRLASMNVVASRSVPSRFVSNDLTLNRSEIQQLEFSPPANSTATDVNFPIDCGDAAQELPKGFRVTQASGPTFAPSILGEFGAGVVRTKPVDGTERLVILMSQAQNNSIFSQKAKVVAWSPVPQRIDGVQQFNDEALHALTTASQEAGLFVSIANGGNQTRLVDFNAGTVTGFPNQLLFDYALLEPLRFYNTSDFKFHSKDSSLASTGSPRSLAPAPNGNPRGRYHWLKLGTPVN